MAGSASNPINLENNMEQNFNCFREGAIIWVYQFGLGLINSAVIAIFELTFGGSAGVGIGSSIFVSVFAAYAYAVRYEAKHPGVLRNNIHPVSLAATMFGIISSLPFLVLALVASNIEVNSAYSPPPDLQVVTDIISIALVVGAFVAYALTRVGLSLGTKRWQEQRK